MSSVLMDMSLHADTHHRAVLIIRLYKILSPPQNLPHLKQSFGENAWRRLSTAIHSPMRVMEPRNRLRYSWFCIRSSVRSDLLLVSHEALPTMQQRLLMIFFLLNQEHGVNNERSQSIQSARHSKLTPHMARPKRP